MKPAVCRSCGQALIGTSLPAADLRFGIPDRYGITACEHCGLYQSEAELSEQELTDLYARYYNFAQSSDATYSRMRAGFFSLFGRLWTVLDSDVSFTGVKGAGRLLDLGCNEGRNLLCYRANGFDAEGLEMNPVAAQTARGLGFRVHTGTVGTLSPEHPYDVVVLSNVLEHATSPTAMLDSVYRLLAPGGQVWISCPNVDSLQRHLFGRCWINWHVPFHIVHFSRETLRRALEGAGFRVLELRSQSPALWSAHSLIAALWARPGRPTLQLRNPLLVGGLMLALRLLLFPLLWAADRAGRGDCLVVRAAREP